MVNIDGVGVRNGLSSFMMVWGPNVSLSNSHQHRTAWRFCAAHRSVSPNELRATPPQINWHRSEPHVVLFETGLDPSAELRREAEPSTFFQWLNRECRHISALPYLAPDVYT